MKTHWLNFLCKIGIHKWTVAGYNSVLNPLPVEVCSKCGIGRQFNIYGGEIRYTRESIKAAMTP